MTPQAGLYCAVVTGFLISALGGSMVQIGGPTGAFVVVVSGIIAEYGLDGLFMCTLMAGVLLVIMGLTGTGTAVRAPLAASIPMAVLAAILLVVSYNMGEWGEIPALWRQGGPIASSGWSRSR